jgi:hypothetical protein
MTYDTLSFVVIVVFVVGSLVYAARVKAENLRLKHRCKLYNDIIVAMVGERRKKVLRESMTDESRGAR